MIAAAGITDAGYNTLHLFLNYQHAVPIRIADQRAF